MLVDVNTVTGLFSVVGLIVSVLILVSYLWLLCEYQGWWNDKPRYVGVQRQLLWSVFWKGFFLYFWTVSVGVCVIGFIYFYYWISFNNGYIKETSSDGDRSWIIIAFMGFLVSSLLYTPLLVFAKQQRKLVILDLFCVAVCAIAMAVWVFLYVVSDQKNTLAFFMSVLAFHCTVLDAGLWGYYWYFEYHYDNDGQFIQYQRPQTTSTQLPNKVESMWPGIEMAPLLPKNHLLLRPQV